MSVETCRVSPAPRGQETFCASYGFVPVRCSTPWSGAPSASSAGDLSSCGGGSFISATNCVVWRLSGSVLTLGELTLCAPEVEEPGLSVSLGSPGPKGGGDGFCRVFRSTVQREWTMVSVATACHVHVLRFGGAAGRVFAEACRERRVAGATRVSLEAVLGGPRAAFGAGCRWAAPHAACFPLGVGQGGGVVQVLVGSTAEESSFKVLKDDAGSPGVVGRLVAGLMGGGEDASKAQSEQARRVVAVATGGDDEDGSDGSVVVAARADWRLSCWLVSSGRLVASVDLRAALRGDALAPPLGPHTRLEEVRGETVRFAVVADESPLPAMALFDAGVPAAAGEPPSGPPRVSKALDAPRWPDGSPAAARELVSLEALDGVLWSSWARDVLGDDPDGRPSTAEGAALLSRHDLSTSSFDVPYGTGRATRGGSLAKLRAAGDDALQTRKGPRTTWAQFFGSDDWGTAAAALEAHFLKRLCCPNRFSARALRNAVAFGLPSVLRRDQRPQGGGAGEPGTRARDVVDDCLTAARDWFHRALSPSATFETKCATLCDTWKKLLRLVDSQAVVEATPLGFVRRAEVSHVPGPPQAHAACLGLLLPTLRPGPATWDPRTLQTHLGPCNVARPDALSSCLADASSRSSVLALRREVDALVWRAAVADPTRSSDLGAKLAAAALERCYDDLAFAAECEAALPSSSSSVQAFSVAALVDEATSGVVLQGALAKDRGPQHAYGRLAPSKLARRCLTAAGASCASTLYDATCTLLCVLLLGAAAGGDAQGLVDATAAVARDLRLTLFLADEAPVASDTASTSDRGPGRPRTKRRVSFSDDVAAARGDGGLVFRDAERGAGGAGQTSPLAGPLRDPALLGLYGADEANENAYLGRCAGAAATAEPLDFASSTAGPPVLHAREGASLT